jgi:hypothetical protein
MAISCETHGSKSTMLVGSMFHWYKAKHPKSKRIFIRRPFSGLASLPNLHFSQNFHKIGNFQESGRFQILREGRFFEEITKKLNN